MEPMTVFDWLHANEVKRQVESLSQFERERSADSVKAADMRYIHAWYGQA